MRDVTGKIRILRTVRAYRELLLDETGQLKPAARIVLKDLWKEAGLFRDMPPDALTLALYEGKKQIINHIGRRAKTSLDNEWFRSFGNSVEEDL